MVEMGAIPKGDMGIQHAMFEIAHLYAGISSFLSYTSLAYFLSQEIIYKF